MQRKYITWCLEHSDHVVKVSICDSGFALVSEGEMKGFILKPILLEYQM